MMRVVRAVLFGVIAFVAIPIVFAAGNEAILSSRYEVNPRPNYFNYADLAIQQSLNDKKYADPPIWMSRNGLAWKDIRRVSITFDLGGLVPIDEIGFHGGARTSAGVEFPYNTFVYLSRDGKVFNYVGDVVNFAEPSSSGYESRHFALKNLGQAARYVQFEFNVRGRYLAVDEIEIKRGGLGGFANDDIPKGDISADVDRRTSTALQSFLMKRLSADLDRLKAPSGDDLLKRRAALLAKSFPNQKFLLVDVEPWEEAPIRLLPKAKKTGDLSRLIPKNGCEYRSLALTNVTQGAQSFRLRQIVKGAGMKVDLKEARPVVAATLNTVVDPLVDIGEVIEVSGGETRVIFLKLCGAGTHSLIVEMSGQTANATTHLQEVPLNAKSQELNGVVWAYLDEPAMRGRQRAAVTDLRDHFINVDVIPWANLPRFNSEELDQIVAILQRSVGVQHVLLFLNFRGNPPAIHSSVWSQQFITWFARMAEAARQAGINPNSLILYPYDEPSVSEMDRAEEFYLWVREVLPGAKLFATFDNELVAYRLARLVDIACVTRAISSKLGIAENLWLYDVKGPGKANPPYSYYLLLPWEAYGRKMSGAGFWSYSDIYGSAWNDFDGRGPDYGVVYQGKAPDQITGSRRWEAWRRGMEDVAILKSHAEQNGSWVTNRIVRRVLALSKDPRQADLARQRMLSDLMRTKQ